MVKTICDICQKEPALDITRIRIPLKKGHNALVSAKIELDEGERDPRRVDICSKCVHDILRDFIRSTY